MAFATKIDYCGLATAITTLTQRDSALNGSSEIYQPNGQDGSYAAIEEYGDDTAPTCNYGVSAVIAATDGQIKLGTITTQNTKKYALESVTISTAAGSAPTVSASSQEVEAAATDATCAHYDVPAFSLSTRNSAQTMFTGYSISGGTLTACTAAISCSVNKDKVEGVKIASDVVNGIVTITGTILQTGSTAPTLTITAASGWVETKPLAISESNPEAAYKTFSFELRKILTKSEQQNGG